MRRLVMLALAAVVALVSFVPSLPAMDAGIGTARTAYADAPSCPDDQVRYRGKQCANKNFTTSNSDKNPKLIGATPKKKKKKN